MADNELLIRYFINTDVKFALVISKQSIRLMKLPDTVTTIFGPQNSEQNSGEKLLNEIVHNDSLKTLLPLNEIYSNKYQKLIIIPDGELHKLPFSAINISKAKGVYYPLARDFSVIRTHSAINYYRDQQTNENVNNNRANVAIFAVGDFPQSFVGNSEGQAETRSRLSNLAEIPGAQTEANFISKLFGPDNTLSGIGKNATRSFLLDKETRSARILHIATHGLFDPLFPEEIGLLALSDDDSTKYELLTYNSLMGSTFDSELVVVSGCDTMLGRYYKGSGLRSLTRGFLSQGARSVLGTLWPVHDKATAAFMQSFYQHLVDVNDSSIALSRAKKEFATKGRFRHPKYWAGFVLTIKHQKDTKSF